MANDDIQVRIVVATAKGKAEIKEFTNTADREFRGMKGSAQKYLGAAGVAGFAAAAGGAIRVMVNRAIQKGGEFEQQLADISAITGITGERLTFLGDQALEQSSRFGEAASNIVEAQKLVASQLAQKIDFSTQAGTRQLSEISEQAIVLQKAAGIDLRTAVEATTSTINQFNLTAEDTPRIINAIAAGAKRGAAEAADQAQAYSEAGSVFAAANEEFEVLNASTQILAANAVKGRRAGTGLRNIMTILQSEAEKLAKHGIKEINVQQDGFIESLRKLQPLMSDTAALAEIFGRENLTAAQILIQNVDAIAKMHQQITGTNTAMDQANKQLDTFQGDVDIATKAVDRLAIALFDRLNPSLRSTAQFTATMAGNLADIAEQQGALEAIVSFFQATTSPAGGLLVAQRAAASRMQEAVQENQDPLRNYKDLLEGTRSELMNAQDAVKDYIGVLEKQGLQNEERRKEFETMIRLYEQLEKKIRAVNDAEDAGASAQAALGRPRIPGTDPTGDIISAGGTNVSAMGRKSPREAELFNMFGSIEMEMMRTSQQLDRNIQGWQKFGDEADEAGDKGEKAMNATWKAADMLGGALAQAALHGKDLGSVLSGIGKQLASRALTTGLGILLTGGIGSVSFFGKMFGFRGGGPVAYAGGGPVVGPGTTTSDSVVARLSRDEHVLTARDVKNMGGHANVMRMRNMAAKMPAFQSGGPVLPDLSTIDRVVNMSRSGARQDGTDRIVNKIEEQTRRLEQVERKVRFALSEFNEANNQFQQNEEIQGRA